MKRLILSNISADKFPLIFPSIEIDQNMHNSEIRKIVLQNEPEERTFRWIEDRNNKI